MSRIRRLAIVTLAAGAVAAFGLAVPAGAYPVGVSPLITVQPGTGTPDGIPITVNCQNFDPNSVCTVTAESTPITLGTVQLNAAGTGSGSFVIPCSIGDGQHTVRATGTSNGTTTSATSLITIANCAATGNLAFTGSSSTPWAAGGIALVLGGLILAVMARRRHTADALTG